jgi:hypothetical protein
MATAAPHARSAETGFEAAQYAASAPPGAPRRVGGTVRSMAPGYPVIQALVPDHLGLTLSDQPTLYWYLSAPTDARIELTLVQPGREAPLLELVLPGIEAGIHAVELRNHGVQLALDVEYEWSVALIADQNQRSRDIVSAGALMRIERASIAAPSVAAFASQGIWYETLMAMEQAVHERPGERAPRANRAALLEQAGLGAAAAFERR